MKRNPPTNKKTPACAGTQDRESRTESGNILMLLSNVIKNLSRSQYFRRLVVRAIEDFIIVFLIYAAIWSVCYVVGGIFNLLGVG